jgi:protease secretion system outer membrane protein
MKNTTYSIPQTMAFQAPRWALALWLLHLSPVMAQVQNQGVNTAAEIERQRAATRVLVEQVTSDQLKPSDTATSLGYQLPVALRPLILGAANPGQATSKLAVRAAQLSLPELEPLGAPALIRRPVRVQPKANFSTPDFSRQSVTFSQLMGKSQIDLPEPEGGLGLSAVRKGDSELQKTTFALPDLVGVGLDFSPELKAIKARQESARQRVSKTRADLLPTFSSRYADGRETTDSAFLTNDKHDYRNTSLRLTQPLFNYPAIENFRASRGTLNAALLRSQASEAEVSMSLVQAVVNLATARVNLAFSDELLDNLSGILKYQDQRTQSGASSQAELERARSRVLAARQSRLEQQGTYKSALLEAERLLGFTPQTLSLPFLNELPPLPRSQAEMREVALRDNAEIGALRAEVEAQQSLKRAQYGRALPTVVASLEDDRSTNNGGVIGKRQDKRALVVLNWTFSLGGKEYFAGNEAAADLDELQNKLAQNEQRITQSVDTDFALLQATTLRINLGQQEQESALRVTEAVREQLKAGRVGSMLEALDASDRLYQARNKLTQSLGQQILGQAQLLRHMGQLAGIREQARVLVQDAPSTDPTSKK